MKKISGIIFAVIVIIVFVYGCKKTVDPTVPGAPDVRATAAIQETVVTEIRQTETRQAEETYAVEALSFTPTSTMTSTYENTPTYTVTSTPQPGSAWKCGSLYAGYGIRQSTVGLIYNGFIWLISGEYKKDVWKSADGINWQNVASSAAFPGRHSHSGVVYNNKMMIIGGYSNAVTGNYCPDVWSSSDGVTWTQNTSNGGFGARLNHSSLVYNGKIWLIGGFATGGVFKNDVWNSVDGTTWTNATASSAFSTRRGHSSVVFKNKMWVIGGNNVSTYKNDVWSSYDGITWTLETSAAGFSGRYLHKTIVYDNKIWVIGGYNGSMLADVWWSVDGINWVRSTSDAGFSGRGGFACFAFDKKIWVAAGSNTYDDVWYSE
ncbi:MAG: hypothetical protein JXR81_06615 [Candidatus Goldbacteria bacterium]|nr:hypothetical protein [Candidatus Goldiibacteriota bacterium]